MPQLAITGATGGLGGRVARRVAARNEALRLVVRDPARAPQLAGATVMTAEYGDAEAMRTALTGVDTLFLVSGTETEDRVTRHLTAVDAAAAAGVRHIVYTSFLGAAPEATFTLARQHWQTEEHIKASGLEWTFLRDSFYADVWPYFVGPDLTIRGPAGDGRGAFVTRDDIADAAAAVLLDPTTAHNGRTYDLTGPAALSLSDVASAIGKITGSSVRYQPETIDEAYASRAHYDAPSWMVDGWVSTYVALRKGDVSMVTDDISRLTGHPATSFESWLSHDEAAIAHVQRLASDR